jgi:hypothetical protein
LLKLVQIQSHIKLERDCLSTGTQHSGGGINGMAFRTVKIRIRLIAAGSFFYQVMGPQTSQSGLRDRSLLRFRSTRVQLLDEHSTSSKYSVEVHKSTGIISQV